MKSNNFDGVAFMYDFLATLFFGKSLRRAQLHFIETIPGEARILVLGSGTGWIAEAILNQKPNSKITLVDASKKMTAIATAKLTGKPVNVICDTESRVFNNPFDVVVLPCFLDLFTDQRINDVIKSINKNTTKDSFWIITDFVSEKLWQRIYLWVMYRFFKVFCKIETANLPGWQTALSNHSLEIQAEQKFYYGFIKSIVCKSK